MPAHARRSFPRTRRRQRRPSTGSSRRANSRGVVSRIAGSALDAAGGPDVLIGYSITLEVWLLEKQLAAGDDVNEVERSTSAAMLAAFAEGNGGCFAPLLADL